MAKKSPLSPEARSIINARVSRRAVLAGIGGVGAAGALAACGSSADSGAGGDLVRWDEIGTIPADALGAPALDMS